MASACVVAAVQSASCDVALLTGQGSTLTGGRSPPFTFEGVGMAQPETPITQQRRLRVELKRARERSGMTQRDVAQALDWSPSKVIRIETGAVIISTSDLMALLPHYGINE